MIELLQDKNSWILLLCIYLLIGLFVSLVAWSLMEEIIKMQKIEKILGNKREEMENIIKFRSSKGILSYTILFIIVITLSWPLIAASAIKHITRSI